MTHTLRHLSSLADWSAQEITGLFELAQKLKTTPSASRTLPLQGKSLGMIFQKHSTRTRISFEVGMFQLGGQALFLSQQDLQLGRGETIADTARVLSRYVDGIMARVYAHQDILDLATHATVPVINGLSDRFHPCQALSDFFTLWERGKELKGLRLCYLGDGNNVAHSLLLAGALLGSQVTLACPPEYPPDPEILALAQNLAHKHDTQVQVVSDPQAAVQNADVLYTDVWASMGQEAEASAREQKLHAFQLNAELTALASPEHLVMHCLPAHRGLEITDEVLDGPHSMVLDQAENRLHLQKALLVQLLGFSS